MAPYPDRDERQSECKSDTEAADDILERSYFYALTAIERGDEAEGIELLRTVANAGHPYAMHDLAVHLRHYGDQQSKAEAVLWYRRASEWNGIGFAGSQNNLGDMYETGDALPQSPGDAVYWYVRSALQGEPTAYLSLGLCFADGIGVQRDPVEAAFWLSIAMRDLEDGSNRDKVSMKLDELTKFMSPEQVAAAMNKANLFRPYIQTPYTIGDPLD